MEKFEQNVKEKRKKKDLRSKIIGGLTMLSVATTIAFASTFPGEYEKVREDSNLWEIAKQHGTTWQKLEKRNNLENPDYIKAGENLIVYHQGPRGLLEVMIDIGNKYWF